MSKELFNNLSSRAEKFYVPLYGEGRAFPVDPVEMLLTTIEWSHSSTTCQLLAGDPGTGRSTEIDRLVRTCSRYAMTLDIGEELHPHTRIDFRTLLLAIHIAVEKATGVASSPTLDIGCEIAANPYFKIPSHIRIVDLLKSLKGSLDYLNDQVWCDEPPVLVFDNLNFEESGRLLDVFGAHAQHLRLPHFHTIYVVPKGLHGGAFDGLVYTSPIVEGETCPMGRLGPS